MKIGDYAFCGFGIKGFRSFSGSRLSVIGPFEKTHIVTGRNNSGKSSLIDFACAFFDPLRESRGSDVDLNNIYRELDKPMDQHNTSKASALELSLCFSLSAVLKDKPIDEAEIEALKKILIDIECLDDKTGCCWFNFKLEPNSQVNTLRYSMTPAFSFDETKRVPRLLELTTKLTGSHLIGGSNAGQANVEKIMRSIAPLHLLPSTIKVEAIRDVYSDPEYKEADSITSGKGLPNALNALRNPSRKKQASSNRRYEAFLAFIRSILDDLDADVLVPSDCSEINIMMEGTPYLPLESLGTGIRELVILAAIVACNDNKLICIEEPEIHLHASLQERLIRYLKANGSNRFILTTHSPTIINSNVSSVTQVIKRDGVSFTKDVSESLDTKRLLQDLGIKPSDIMQANYVIWVEGPSDRIYIKYWISCVNPNLLEGVHYSIMHYGGKLLSGIEASSKSTDASLSNVFSINPNFCILMDSDRTKPRERINATKIRIRNECKKSDAFAWVTEGRTIENYVPSEVLKQALDNLYKNKSYDHPLDNRYICPLGFTFKGVTYGPNKIDVAHEVSKIGYELSGDLLHNINKLNKEIMQANCIVSP